MEVAWWKGQRKEMNRVSKTGKGYFIAYESQEWKLNENHGAGLNGLGVRPLSTKSILCDRSKTEIARLKLSIKLMTHKL